ncbi:fructose-1,6-bisphosphate aldolase/phosphatase [Thermococcus celer]|uniref:Fructose-1,6-bisphosphate aldolase/phosphatase n=1 Tax=Thermococcus celer Vu 13 = JCM 8558 TaxID=1293037 RepID=A0A218P2T4_THECE|nr:fructose-1,6-bisphosphate aldolase/phosphatase [Thermococcus celer]ASI99231.1 fructose 1,6-bisphosphatase [Thermococcus celer Vu 13 = JCM 8558]
MATGEKITISVIKADIGGWPGHSRVHPQLVETAEEVLAGAKEKGTIIDFYVATCGDDLQLIMTHGKGVDSPEIHGLAWKAFEEATKVARGLGLYGAGQDLLKDAFSGNIRGMGPGIAEMEITLRKSEPVVTFHMDKTEPGAFNLPVFRMFADPFNTAGLVIDPNMHMGFRFEVWDIKEHKRVILNTPEELYDLLALIGAKSRYVIKRVFPKEGHKIPKDEPVAVISTEKLYQIAGEYVGKDDPVAIVRAQSGLPALGEVLEPFAFPHLVSGWMRGSHNGPVMPVPMRMANPTRFDGPPRVVALGWQISPEGRLVGPVDLFDDPAFDEARRKAIEIADYMRRHGPFEPHRLPMEDMEYTTLPGVLERLEGRFEPVE